MSDTPAPIRSYQRIFKPERRIYQIDGRRLPVPGGVPLVWLAWAAGTLLVVLALGSRSLTLTLGVAFAAALTGAGYGGWFMAAVAGGFAFTVAYAAGVVVGALDWPLRLVVLPARSWRRWRGSSHRWSPRAPLPALVGGAASGACAPLA